MQRWWTALPAGTERWRTTLLVRRRSTKAWVQRQANDHFVAQAKRLGLRSRAAFKLDELDKKLGLLRAGDTVLDLGASPGSWSQIAAERVGKAGHVVAADLLSMQPIHRVHSLQLDVFDDDAEATLRTALAERVPNVILSDMAPDTCGIRDVDHWRSIELCERALALARALLADGGHLVCKLFDGGDEPRLRKQFTACFAKVRRVKPASSRKESRELFVVGTGFHAPGESAPIV